MAFAQEKQETRPMLASVDKLPALASPLGAGDENAGDAEHNPIFEALVTDAGELAGLVAYSLYKQNKRAWLADFIKATGRPPSEGENRAYVIGEATERRLAAYRYLAKLTLEGQGPDTPAAKRQMRQARARSWLPWSFAVLAALGMAALAVHGGSFAGVK